MRDANTRRHRAAAKGMSHTSPPSLTGSTATRRQFVAGAASAGLALALPFPPRSWQERQFDTVVVGGRLVDPAEGIDAPRDIGVTGGWVARVAERIAESEGRQVVRAHGMIVTPGLIDIHVHVYDGVSGVSIEPDVVGIAKGVTTVVDAGSSGATTFPGFRTYVAGPARTRVYALLNVSSPGMTISNELADLGYVDPDAIVATVEANREVIVGLKVRMLAGIPGGNDIEVMRLTRLAAEGAGVPIMVHIGGQTSPLPRILEMLRPGDVVTHALRRSGSIFDGAGNVYPEVLEAVERGIHLDIGHGRGNLDFDIAERALDQGIRLAAISSDVHRGNALGPVFGLPTTLTKFLHMGMSLEEVIRCATSTPAGIFDFGEELGTLREGAVADLVPLPDGGGRLRAGGFRGQAPDGLAAPGAVRGHAGRAALRGDHAMKSVRFLAPAALVAALTPANGDAATVPVPTTPQLPYDTEYPTIPYATGETGDPVAVLARGLETGEVTLDREGPSAYLAAVLRELRVPVSSQMLVFSKTSLLARLIWPETPRAIYFNDHVYVAWTPGADGLEISAQDPELGPVFYNLEPDGEGGPRIRRQTGLCLQCHDSFSLTGGGVPRHIMGSGPTDENGQLASHELWQVTTDTTPIRERWGGWYVTGTHGDQLHMGNVALGRRGDSLTAGGNITDLSELIDVTPYLGTHSDIVALLVAEHQTTVQNLITLLGYRVRTRLHIDQEGGLPPGEMSPRTTRLVEGLGESLVRALFFVGTPRLEDPIKGTSTFTSDFMAAGRQDSQGRSLRDLDLHNRLFRYPLSYLIHSPEYDALPAQARAYVDGRILSILRGEEGGRDFAHLSAGDREAVLSILRDTRPGIVGQAG